MKKRSMSWWWIIGCVLWLAQYLVLIPAAAWGEIISILWSLALIAFMLGVSMAILVFVKEIEKIDLENRANKRLADRPGRDDDRSL